MNQEIKEKWVSALKSGEYKQGDGKLRSKDNFCCLGVLCDIYHKETGKGEWNQIVEDNDEYETEDFNFIAETDKSEEILPVDVAEWANITLLGDLTNPVIVDLSSEFKNLSVTHRRLTDLNDNGYTFEQIAEIIEQEDSLEPYTASEAF